MNIRIFNSLMKEGGLKQEPWEWRMFLDFCSIYLKNHKIKNPIVVELGVLNNRQKEFYEQLFDATHIGIDISKERSIPDILGDTHDSRTLNALKTRLRGNSKSLFSGKPINILFIDAAHGYEDVKMDFEMYAPLCGDIIAIHDTETCRGSIRKLSEVWRFWDKLKLEACSSAGEFKDSTFITIFKKTKRGQQRGIGLILKK